MISSVATQKDLTGVSFCCGNAYIDNYFANEILKDSDAVSYCFWTDETKQELVGIASLSCSGILVTSHSQLSLHPAVEVKIFAVDVKYQHKTFPNEGENWSDYCWYYLMKIIYDITKNSCGASHVVLYSVPDAVNFYKRKHFNCFTDDMTKPANWSIQDCEPMFVNL